MKFLRTTDQGRVYALQPAELQMLLVVLGSFPLLNHSQAVSKSGDGEQLAEAQQLLEEALAERRQVMRHELEQWMQTPGRFSRTARKIEWQIENDRREWLLQILNDVRVGAWRELGSPESLEAARERSDEQSGRHVALMELAGMFQMTLLLEDES
ncbi:MAG TPA: hypothetical protein VLD18_05945 [Verrucomicrobiae bacterium]|nr:hypothetical protein [Verrucomicrobiae bacterium]